MKKMWKLLGLSLAVALIAATMAACGGSGPSYVTNPPSDPKDLVTKLKADDYMILAEGEIDEEDAADMYEMDGMKGITALVMGMKTDMKVSDATNLDKKVTVEMAMVMYFKDEASAKAAHKDSKNAIDSSMKDGLPDGVKATVSITQKGKTVSAYVKVSCKIGDMM